MTNKSPGRPKNPPTARKILKDILPIKDIFTEEELVIYESLVDIYMKDFDEEDLSSVDIDDIMFKNFGCYYMSSAPSIVRLYEDLNEFLYDEEPFDREDVIFIGKEGRE